MINVTTNTKNFIQFLLRTVAKKSHAKICTYHPTKAVKIFKWIPIFAKLETTHKAYSQDRGVKIQPPTTVSADPSA